MKTCLSLMLLLASVAVSAAPELKGSPDELRGFLHPNNRTMSISESAEKTAYSDIALVHLVISTEEDLLSEAMSENSRLRSTIRERLVAKGIAADQINSARFSSVPQYGWFGKKPDSFKVVNRMVIRIQSEQHLQLIASLADEKDEITLSQTTFEHSGKDAFQEQVKQDALDRVLAKKRYYEQTLGIKLMPVAFYDNPMPMVPTDGARIVEEVVVANARAEGAGLASMRKMASAPETASFDEVKYKAQVTVEFEIVK